MPTEARPAARPVTPAPGRFVEQIPAFATIGFLGYFSDAATTYFFARYVGLPPWLARQPSFILVTIFIFLLNRSITFRHTRAPLLGSFVRYLLVASAGFVVNYAVYLACVVLAPSIGIVVTPAILPLFVAAGCGAAMTLTFVGFRYFAFRM